MTCNYCGEEILAGDEVHKYSNGPVEHRNCFLRNLIGSVAHVRGECGCFVPGSTASDPPGMSLREAANLAVKEWKEQQDATTVAPYVDSMLSKLSQELTRRENRRNKKQMLN